jgi:hypothetical protein
VESSSFAGRSILFSEIEIRKDCALLRYSCQKGSDEAMRRLHATLLFLRALRLVPNLKADLSELSAFLLPAVESAEDISTTPFELARKKCADLSSTLSELSAKNRMLSRASEEAAGYCSELERRASALQERVRKLEQVPDQALKEMVSEWLSSHRGAFNAAAAAKALGISPARCEEGLSMLLEDGAIRKIGASFTRAKSPQPRLFEVRQAQGFAQKAASAARSIFRKK